MTKIYTESHLLRYYYSETDLFETLEIEYALSQSLILRKKYATLKSKLSLLSGLTRKPSQASVEKILAYSRS